jgi:hypothetical protein
MKAPERAAQEAAQQARAAAPSAPRREDPAAGAKVLPSRALNAGLAKTTDRTWELLCERFNGKLAASDIEYLFARYVLGLTGALCARAPFETHLHIWRTLVARTLTAPRAEWALHYSAVGEVFTKACQAVERLGRADGIALMRGPGAPDDEPAGTPPPHHAHS